MKISAFIATRNGATRNPPGHFAHLLAKLREISNEVVVAVDETTTDGTFEVAEEFTKTVSYFQHDSAFGEMRRQSFARCSGDWILHMDDDVLLGKHWTRGRLEDLAGRRSVTHYWMPTRRLVESPERYISTWPYIGDFGVALFRNISSIAVIPTTVHQEMAVAGEPVFLGGMYLDEADFLWHDRAFREAKVRQYNELDPDRDNDRMYLYEDYYFESESIDDSLVPEVVTEVSVRRGGGVEIQVLRCPSKMTAGQAYWADVRIINRGARALLPQLEFIQWGTLALSYRWFSAADHGQIVEQDRILTPFPARIDPGYQHDALVTVRVPAEPERYYLQIDIFDGSVGWLSDAGESTSPDLEREVHAPLLSTRS